MSKTQRIEKHRYFIKKLNVQQDVMAQTVWELQMKSYRVEADLIGLDDFPPLRQTVADLKQSAEVFYGCFDQHQLIGILSIEIDSHTLIITRMIVDPLYFRKGVAKQLLLFVESLKSERISVSTALKNVPAVQLYTKNGYKKIKEEYLTGGIVITTFTKWLTSHSP